MTDDLLTPPPPAAPQPRVWRMKQPTKDAIREQLAAVTAERDALLRQNAELRLTWWQKARRWGRHALRPLER